MIATSNICLAVMWQSGGEWFLLIPRAELGPKGESARGVDFDSDN